MSLKWLALSFSVLPAVLLVAADDSSKAPTPQPAWATKQSAQWSQEEAQQLLKDSPWVKSLTPSIVRGNPEDNRGLRPMSRRGGFGFPGGGYPGGGYPGGGYPGGGYPGGYPPQNQYPQNPPAKDSSTADEKPPVLTLRWESALPVREAELKARDENAPTLEDENHYAIAVYGIPASMANGDLKGLAEECKKKATLSRDGKKDLKPSSVQVLRREDGPVVLFLFLKPKSAKEQITKEDRRVEFDAQIKRYSISQAFYLDDMTFQGKTEI
jgi:hypothetical protein